MKWLAGILLLLLPMQCQAAERILALSPHACEILYAIGAGSEVVGGVDYCDYPAAAKQLPRVGTHDRIHAETALSLKPTMAIVFSGQTAGIKALERVGVRIVVSRPETVQAMLNDIERLGRLSGHAVEAGKLVAALRRQMGQLARSRPAPAPAVFYELWPDPLMTVGGKGLMQDVLAMAGLKNVFSGLPLESARVNIESVMRAKPSLVIVPAEMRDVGERRRFWHQWLHGVRVVTVNPDLLQRPGPRLIEGIAQLMQAVAGAHP